MVFHGISIIVRTANDCDFQRQKRYISVEEEAQQLDRSNVSDALFPHRRRCAKKPFCQRTPKIRRYLSGYRCSICHCRYGTETAKRKRKRFMWRGSSRARCAFEKSFEDLAADVFAFRSTPRGCACVRACTRVHQPPRERASTTARCSRRWHRPILFADTFAFAAH